MNYFLLLDIMKDFIDPLMPYWLELLILFGLLLFLMMLGICETFRKAGKPAWGAWIPIYNLYLLFDIIDKNGWKFLTLLIPGYNIFQLIILPFKLAKKFNHGFLFGFFLLIFPFGGYPVLGFDDSKYVDRKNKKKVVSKNPSKVVEEKIEKEEVIKEEIEKEEPIKENARSNSKNTEESISVATSSLAKRRELAAKKRAMAMEETKKSEEKLEIKKEKLDKEQKIDFVEQRKQIVSELEKFMEMMEESKKQREAKEKKNKKTPIINVEDPAFQALKESLNASIQKINQTEKKKKSLITEEDAKILKKSLESSLQAIKEHLVSEVKSTRKETRDSKADKNRLLLLDELDSIESILGNLSVTSVKKEIATKKEKRIKEDTSDPLSSELSFLDSILDK